MFIHREGDPSGFYLITQSSHAWMAWQLAEHWGNRDFARPAPRAETLAAILLHDGGWTDFDDAPGVDAEGRPRTFDRMPVVDHLDIWRRCVHQVASHSRYSALLVAAHFAGLARRKRNDLLERDDTIGARSAQAFIAEMERVQTAWWEALREDLRYRPFVDGVGREINASLLAACDRISVYLCANLATKFTVPAPTPTGEMVDLEFEERGHGEWRVRPWPMEGGKITVHCEARRVADQSYDSSEDFNLAVAGAPVTRLRFTVARLSAGS